jgi:Ca2+/Na+ antiporter
MLLISLLITILILITSAVAVVAAVKYLLMLGIINLSATFNFSAKVRGQIIGYATSIPELTVLVAGALAGVFKAGLWNIASSNIINWVLFLLTVVVYRQQLDLKNKWFIDEILFGIMSVAIPLLLIGINIKLGFSTAIGLILFFIVYRVFDKIYNKKGQPAPLPPGTENGTLIKGLLLLTAGIVVILIVGRFLSMSAGSLILFFNIPDWAVGWILGSITSISELTSFIEIYDIHKPKSRTGYIKDTQEAIDALVTSNISNIGLILPLGIIIYLISG